MNADSIICTSSFVKLTNYAQKSRSQAKWLRNYTSLALDVSFRLGFVDGVLLNRDISQA
jgi:hypothetical protein